MSNGYDFVYSLITLLVPTLKILFFSKATSFIIHTKQRHQFCILLAKIIEPVVYEFHFLFVNTKTKLRVYTSLITITKNTI